MLASSNPHGCTICRVSSIIPFGPWATAWLKDAATTAPISADSAAASTASTSPPRAATMSSAVTEASAPTCSTAMGP